jgi:hypothetical protein
MAGKSDAFEADILKLIFNGTAIGNLADNTVTGPLTALWVALHTADPTDAGVQSSNEIAYTGYARVSVARTTGGWAVSGTTPTQVAPVATIAFPAGTGGTGTATFFSVGVASSGATKILYSGAITPSIVCGAGITPQLTTASTITED